MIVSTNEKVHIVTRRLFDGDLRRHFAGVVVGCTEEAIRVRGYAFIFDQTSGEFTRRKNERTRLFGIADAGLVINVLPETVDPNNLRYATDESDNRVLTDDHGFTMNVSEFGACR